MEDKDGLTEVLKSTVIVDAKKVSVPATGHNTTTTNNNKRTRLTKGNKAVDKRTRLAVRRPLFFCVETNGRISFKAQLFVFRVESLGN